MDHLWLNTLLIQPEALASFKTFLQAKREHALVELIDDIGHEERARGKLLLLNEITALLYNAASVPNRAEERS